MAVIVRTGSIASSPPKIECVTSITFRRSKRSLATPWSVRTSDAFEEGSRAAELDAGMHRALEKIVRELEFVLRDTLDPEPLPGIIGGVSSLNFRVIDDFDDAVIQSPLRRIEWEREPGWYPGSSGQKNRKLVPAIDFWRGRADYVFYGKDLIGLDRHAVTVVAHRPGRTLRFAWTFGEGWDVYGSGRSPSDDALGVIAVPGPETRIASTRWLE